MCMGYRILVMCSLALHPHFIYPAFSVVSENWFTDNYYWVVVD